MADSAEPNVVIITNPDTDQIVDIIPYDISTDTLKIKEKYGGKPMFLGEIKGGFIKKDKKIDLKESSTITIYSKNKTIINQRRAQGDLIILPNHDKKAKVVSNKNGKVVMKIE